MSKILIAVVTCHRRREFSRAIRSTWLPLVPGHMADVRFFSGRGAARDPMADEVFLDCDDEYLGLPDKVQSIYRWAYDQGYDYVLKCDDDVVLDPVRLLTSDFTNHLFTGWQDPGCKPGEIRTPWGFCYWLAKPAYKLVIDNPLPGRPGSINTHVHGNDEAWVSTVLHYSGIFLHDDPRYYLYQGAKPAPTQRPLRAPKRAVAVTEMGLYYDSFAWCIYLNWTGWHNTGPEVILQEFHKVFKDRLCHC